MTRNNAATTVTMPSELEIVITRDFDVPRRLVFEAWTKPEHVQRWYGLREMTMVVCEIDLRVGGSWRYVVRASNGSDYGFSGEYRKIVPSERLVYTEGFEAMPGHDHLVTVTFDEHDGKTTLASRHLYQSAADRDGHVQSGMERGMRVTMDRLADHLQTMGQTSNEGG